MRDDAPGKAMSEERYVYDGPGSLSASDLNPQGRAARVLFLHVDAVFPRLTEPPALTRVEYEIVRGEFGWEKHNGFHALSGWRKRVGERCAGFEIAFALAQRHDLERSALLSSAMSLYMPRAQASTAPIEGSGSGQPLDHLLSAILNSLASLRAAGRRVDEITVYLNESQDFVDDLTGRIRDRDSSIAADIRRAHPQLGLLSERLPLPEEFEMLDDWLEKVAPLPGTVRPEN